MLLAPAVVLMALLDVAGIASIAPFLGLLSDPGAVERSRTLSYLYETLGFSNREAFFFAVGVGVLGVLTFGNIFNALTTWALLRFSWMRNHSLSMRLLESYLRRPYAFFLRQNTTELAQRILSEVQSVVSGVLVQSINTAARVVVIALILVTLLMINPVMAVSVGVVFGGVYGSLFWMVRRQLARIGEARVKANQVRFKLASEMFSGIKEVKLAGLERTFLQRYASPSRGYGDAIAKAHTIAQLPRYALETVAFGGVLLMVLFALRSGSRLNDVLPIVGLYAFASYRILPGLQQVFSGMTSIRTNVAALDLLVRDVGPAAHIGPSEPSCERLPFEEAATLERVQFTYANAAKPTIHALDLSISSGEWIALIGPTGSGKTTLVDILLGLLRPTTGTMVVDGEPITEDNISAWQANVGYVPQQIFMADDTIARNVAFGAESEDIDWVLLEEVARVAQLHDFIVGELPRGYETKVGERGARLSGGQRQRVGIARALYRKPRLLVLDEATSALDNETEWRFFEDLRRTLGGVSVVSIAHRLTTTRSFDRIYVMKGGAIVDSGGYRELSARSSLFDLDGAQWAARSE